MAGLFIFAGFIGMSVMVSIVVLFKAQRLRTVSMDPFKGRDIVTDLNFYNQYEITAAERNQVRKGLEKMFKTLNLRTLYKEF